jgi:ectoine hydroxylase-related dioxygenase (phytanoyl-CoA dioxygenase family)
MNWNSIRIAQDDVLWKPPDNNAAADNNKTVVGYHQDSNYISEQFVVVGESSAEKSTAITVWMALDDVDPTTGSVEYVKGSHKWNYGRAGSSDEHQEVCSSAMMREKRRVLSSDATLAYCIFLAIIISSSSSGSNIVIIS